MVSSTAIRALQTARYCLEETEISIHRIETFGALEELHQGTWTGRLREEIYTAEQIAAIAAEPWSFRPPQGESQDDVFRRTPAWLQQHVLSLDYRHTWVFCHGLVIKLTLTGLLDLDRRLAWRIPIDNASITTLVHDGSTWFERRRNDTDHCVDIAMGLSVQGG